MRIIIDNEDEFTKLVLDGLTIAQLQEHYACSRSAVLDAKRRFGLIGISPNSKKRDNGDGTKICNTCHTTKSMNDFYSNGYYKGRKKLKPSCKSCENAALAKKHISLVLDILDEQNRKCACELCGYNKNFAALCFHHMDSEEKDFQISSKRTASRAVLAPEIAKCALLCHNCHMEFHYPTLQLNQGGD